MMLLLSVTLDLPVIYPSGDRAAFVGVHYIYPLIGVAMLGVITFFVGRRDIALHFLAALPCYAIVLFVHFNIKLWVPYVNPTGFDELYWQIDTLFRPAIDFCIMARKSLVGLIPYQINFYMTSYIMLFYCSFCYHALKTPEQFHKLIVAVLLLQALGSLAYLVAPAIGPFIYEAGANPLASEGQRGMLAFYHQAVAAGPAWLAGHGGANFTAGLAAMPSLHAAGAFLFVLFAWHHGRKLLPLYIPILCFIVVTAIANRWHYLIDIPFGMALAWASYRLAARLTASVAGPRAGDHVIAPVMAMG